MSEFFASLELRDTIGATALLLSLFNLWLNLRHRRIDPIRVEAIELIKQLRCGATEISDAIVGHVTFIANRKKKQDVYALYTKLDQVRIELENRLPKSAKEELFRDAAEWWKKISAHFPIDNKTGKFREDGAEVKMINEAACAYSRQLDHLLLQIRRGRIHVS